MANFNLENAQQNSTVPYGLYVRRGDYPKLGGIDKFGYLPTASTAYKTVWDGDSIYT